MAAKAKDEEAEVEDELEEGEEGAAEKPKRSLLSFLKLPSLKLPSLKMMIIGAAGLLVVAGGAGGAYFYFFQGSEHKEAAKPPAKPAIFVDLPDVLVNLSNVAAERTQYLKVKIVLELPDARGGDRDPAADAAGDGRLPDLFARIAADRSRRLRGPLPAQGGIDPPGQ